MNIAKELLKVAREIQAESPNRLRDKILGNVDSMWKATGIYSKVNRKTLSEIALATVQLRQLAEMANDFGDTMLAGRCDRALSHLKDFDEFVTASTRKLKDAQDALERIEQEVRTGS